MGGGHPSCPARGKEERYKLPLGDLGGGPEANAVCIEQKLQKLCKTQRLGDVFTTNHSWHGWSKQ